MSNCFPPVRRMNYGPECTRELVAEVAKQLATISVRDSDFILATAATGSVSASGTGSPVVTGVTIGESASAITGLGTPTTANCLTGVTVTTQPTVALSTGATAGAGVISVATGITSASTAVNNKDEVTAVTSIGTGTAAAQNLTIS